MSDSAHNPLKVKLSTSFPQWPLLRQTPGGGGRWKDAQFYVDQPVDECDAWFVCGGLVKPETTVCPGENIVFVSCEPPSVKVHDAKWLRQFGRVITSQRNVRHPGVGLSQTGLPWHVGKSYDELSQAQFPAKSKGLSIIASNKNFTAGHQRRLAFVEELGRRGCGDLFGRGIRELANKWDGLAEYRYSVAIENCRHPDYWTEKIADCFLAGTVPFYYGCPNIGDYFPTDAYVWIDLDNPEKAVGKIEGLLAANDYEKRRPALAKAKELVLNEYNLFNLLACFCGRLNFGSKRRKVQLRPEVR
ncbi:MAG: glycosyltransferase family 10 [Verrucomicrobiota bacterium]|jgi:hypothetical protein